MVARKGQTPTLPILNAVDRMWNAIRKNHPEVPPVTLVVGSAGRKKTSITYGHFHANQWEVTEGEGTHEVMLSGESLQRGAEATLGTLLHEAAHGAAHMQDIEDTSNKGRYHNAKFKKVAEGFGIQLEKDGTRGWSSTTVPEATVAKYRKEVDALAEVLVAYKRGNIGIAASTPKGPRNSTKIKLDCGCESPFTMSKIEYEKRGSITCGDCLDVFTPVA